MLFAVVPFRKKITCPLILFEVDYMLILSDLSTINGAKFNRSPPSTGGQENGSKGAFNTESRKAGKELFLVYIPLQ